MDELEADYLRQQIQELRQANRRWKALAILSLCVLGLFVLAGGATLLTGGLLAGQRMREEAIQARKAEMMAREQAEDARMQAERAREEAVAARRRAEEEAEKARAAAKAAEPGKP